MSRINERDNPFDNRFVLPALLNRGWFTAGLIERLRKYETLPFEDLSQGVREFFEASWDVPNDASIYSGALHFVSERMGGRDGHPFRIKNIAFCDRQVLALAARLGIDGNWETDRAMLYSIDSYINSIVAPEPIRKTVISQTLRWGDTSLYPGAQRRRIDTLLTAELVKRGIGEYLKSQSK